MDNIPHQFETSMYNPLIIIDGLVMVSMRGHISCKKKLDITSVSDGTSPKEEVLINVIDDFFGTKRVYGE